LDGWENVYPSEGTLFENLYGRGKRKKEKVNYYIGERSSLIGDDRLIYNVQPELPEDVLKCGIQPFAAGSDDEEHRILQVRILFSPRSVVLSYIFRPFL